MSWAASADLRSGAPLRLGHLLPLDGERLQLLLLGDLLLPLDRERLQLLLLGSSSRWTASAWSSSSSGPSRWTDAPAPSPARAGVRRPAGGEHGGRAGLGRLLETVRRARDADSVPGRRPVDGAGPLLDDVGQLVGQRALVRGRAGRVPVAEDDLVPDRVGVGVDGPGGGRRRPARVDPDVGEVGSERRLHALPDRRLEGLPGAAPDDVPDRRLLLLLARQGGGHPGVPRGALQAHDRRRVPARRSGRRRRRGRRAPATRRPPRGWPDGPCPPRGPRSRTSASGRPSLGRAQPAHSRWWRARVGEASRGAPAGIKVRSGRLAGRAADLRGRPGAAASGWPGPGRAAGRRVGRVSRPSPTRGRTRPPCRGARACGTRGPSRAPGPPCPSISRRPRRGRPRPPPRCGCCRRSG